MKVSNKTILGNLPHVLASLVSFFPSRHYDHNKRISAQLCKIRNDFSSDWVQVDMSDYSTYIDITREIFLYFIF